MDELWEDSNAAGREFESIGGKKRMQDIVIEILKKRVVKGCDPNQDFDDYNAQISNNTPVSPSIDQLDKTMKPSPTKRIVKWFAIVFVASCLIPPWQFTADRNGNYGFHSHKPAGYSLIFIPPANPDQNQWNGVQIDFGRLLIEWAVVIVIVGIVLFLRNDKELN